MVEKNLTALIGDFYECHAGKEFEKMASVLQNIEAELATGQAAHAEFMDYFNEMFSGRTAFNTLLNVKDYPVESVIRELFQNAFDCDYNEDIKLAVNFKDNDTISISYNEVGFTLEQFMFYLSFGRNKKQEATSEGRFGVGAKSVFMNVEWLSMRSNNFSFLIMNNDGMLKITDINIKRPIFKGTEIVIKTIDEEQYERIKENFVNITGKKSDYINLVELCFAFNKKKILNTADPGAISPEAGEKRSFNIAVMENGKLIELYKVFNHYNKAVDVNVIRFTQGGKSVVDFICYEENGFVYLIPFALALSKRSEMIQLLKEKYNYFSTYELTGLLKSEESALAGKKLSAFFISVPNRNITSFRTGIRPEKEGEVISHVEVSVKKIIEEYGRFFVLGINPNAEGDGFYHLVPESYAFDFIKSFVLKGRMNLPESVKRDFLQAVSLRYSKNEVPMHYTDMQSKAYSSSFNNVSKEDHWNGKAYQELIINKLAVMNKLLADIPDRILYTGYEWVPDPVEEGQIPEEDNLGGVTYLYEIHKDGNIMYISSENNIAGTDYDLHGGFMSMAGYITEKAVKGGKINNENQLFDLFNLLNSIYDTEYKIALKDNQLVVVVSSEEYTLATSELAITNLSGFLVNLQRHKQQFLTYSDYSGTMKLMLDIFVKSKTSLVEFLRAAKTQNIEILLQKDEEGIFNFIIYETPFKVPSKMPNAEILELIGDLNLLINSGVLKGRDFGFKYEEGPYNFEPKKIAKVLSVEPIKTAEDVIKNINICDLKADKVALLNKNDVIIDVISIADIKEKPDYKSIDKYIILSGDMPKEEFADVIELLLTGKNQNLMRRRYLGAPNAKIVIADQQPYYEKPILAITKDEFKHLQALAKKTNDKGYSQRNFYAKDVNSKLFGYGGKCSFCGFESAAINGFSVRDFEVELMHGGREKHFNFSLYLCADCAILSDCRVVDEMTVGGISPFLWLEKVKDAKEIAPEMLKCVVTYREQITNDLPQENEESFKNAVMSAEKLSEEILLSPSMAARWVVLNAD